MSGGEILAVSSADFLLVLIILCLIVVPIAAIAFARSGRAYSEIGKGQFAVDFDESGESDSHEEVRQLVEAKAFRQSQRGEQPVDVEAEVDRLLGTGETSLAEKPALDSEETQIREEIRQVVLAKNESRLRRGEDPLDVESEVDRMLGEFG